MPIKFTIWNTPLMILPPMIPAQGGQSVLINGIVFAVLAGATLFAICRSSNRN